MKTPVTLILLTLLVFGCADDSKNNSDTHNSENEHSADTIHSDTPAVAESLMINDSLTNLAYYLAGITPDDTTAFQGAFQSDVWKNYQLSIESSWEAVKEKRLSRLIEWQKSELSGLMTDSLPLFYPFSGPDFLHANSFYPDASDYYFIAIEPVLALPDVTASDFNSKSFLNALQHGLRDVLGKSYFITTHMMEDLTEKQAEGVLPTLFVFLARTGHEIVDVYPVEVDNTGQIYAHDSLSYEANQAVQFVFRKKDSQRTKTLTYFNRSISDRDLDNKFPEFGTFLDSGLSSCNSFVKAASYLMHYDGFSYVRNAVLKHSHFIFQDDTGVPFRYIDQNEWRYRLYGEYTPPIKDFSRAMYQSDLDKLYDQTPAAEKYTIPFSLGYHIVGDKIQNHQIFIRQ